MKTIRHTALAAAICIAITLTPGIGSVSHADPPPGKGTSNKGNPNKGNSGNHGNNHNNQWVNKSLSNTTAELISAGITIAAARALAVDVGAVGFKPLPPGIAKNLARGKPLPPGIATRSLPNNLLKGLPQHKGYEWVAAGADLVLINAASRLVADVLSDALR